MTRVIPCLDIRDGRVVKGIHFVDLVDAGDPVQVAKTYSDSGADELVFLDITASHEGRRTLVDTVYKVAEQVFIPLTVGGGISDIDLVRQLLRSGADKISVNSPAVRDPSLISRLADKFGSQCITVAVDARWSIDHWEVIINGGRIPTGIDVLSWVRQAEKLGCGEILLTSMDTDGTRNGYDIALLDAVSSCVRVPIVASGGAGSAEHFSQAVTEGHASAVLAASLFHYGILSIQEVKEQMQKDGLSVRTIARNEKI